MMYFNLSAVKWWLPVNSSLLMVHKSALAFHLYVWLHPSGWECVGHDANLCIDHGIRYHHRDGWKDGEAGEGDDEITVETTWQHRDDLNVKHASPSESYPASPSFCPCLSNLLIVSSLECCCSSCHAHALISMNAGHWAFSMLSRSSLCEDGLGVIKYLYQFCYWMYSDDN